MTGIFKFEGNIKVRTVKNFTRPRKKLYRGTICFPLPSPLGKNRISIVLLEKKNGVRYLVFVPVGSLGRGMEGRGPRWGLEEEAGAAEAPDAVGGGDEAFVNESLQPWRPVIYTTLHHLSPIIFLTHLFLPSLHSPLTPYKPYLNL